MILGSIMWATHIWVILAFCNRTGLVREGDGPETTHQVEAVAASCSWKSSGLAPETLSCAQVRLYFPRKIPVFWKRSEMFVPSPAGYSSLCLVYSLASYLGICHSLCLKCCSLTLWSANLSCKMPGKVSPWFRHLAFWAPTEFTPTLCESAE